MVLVQFLLDPNQAANFCRPLRPFCIPRAGYLTCLGKSVWRRLIQSRATITTTITTTTTTITHNNNNNNNNSYIINNCRWRNNTRNRSNTIRDKPATSLVDGETVDLTFRMCCGKSSPIKPGQAQDGQ
jgi:hypothetical protein